MVWSVVCLLTLSVWLSGECEQVCTVTRRRPCSCILCILYSDYLYFMTHLNQIWRLRVGPPSSGSLYVLTCNKYHTISVIASARTDRDRPSPLRSHGHGLSGSLRLRGSSLDPTARALTEIDGAETSVRPWAELDRDAPTLYHTVTVPCAKFQKIKISKFPKFKVSKLQSYKRSKFQNMG